ncbi:putative manganese transporter [Collinsella tanakaei]|uniref:putative manganese transporter n=1 Tax=Collinsella tanakaei TaxID=626935 RepID=UPI0026F1DF2D|nr:putative manganese transporter [Collinsella tanakaei]
MDLLLHFVEHALEDTLSLVPFLFVTYLVLEALEHAAGNRVNAAVRRAGAAGPVVGAALGVLPQCGFSAMAATLYAGRVVTLGTLVAVFLSTSDEMLPMLLAERVDASSVATLLAAKAAIALISGVVVDAALRALRRNARVHAAIRRTVLGPKSLVGEDESRAADIIDSLSEAGEGAEHIHRLCERDHCGCEESHAHHHGEDEDHMHGEDHGHGDDYEDGDDGDHHGHAHQDGVLGSGSHGVSTACACSHGHGHDHAHGGSAVKSIVLSALSHTVQVTVFIFIVTFALVAVLETVGEPAMEAFLSSNRAFAILGSALVGIIPNCSASVVITQLYLEGVLSLAPAMAGLLVSAGVGYLVLFRTNRSMRENIAILILLYLVAVLWGFVLMLLGF